METSQHWNSRVTVVKTIKMMLVRQTSRRLSELSVMFLHVVSPVYKSSCPLIVRGWGESQSLNRHLSPYQLPASKIKQIFHQLGLFNGFFSSKWPDSTFLYTIQFSSGQWLSHVWLFATPWTAAHQASLSITNSWNLLKLISTESVMPSNHLILCCPLLLLPSVFLGIRVFSNESALSHQVAKVLEFQL